MKPYTQLLRHNPAQGQWGDCLRTGIACLLEVEPSTVPHFMDQFEPETGFSDLMQAWLMARYGLYMASFYYAGETGLDSILGAMRLLNPNMYYLLSGSPSPPPWNELTHVVICKDDEIVWDPHPDKIGVRYPDGDGMFLINLLVPVWLTKSLEVSGIPAQM